MDGTHDLALTWRDGREAVVRAREDETVIEAAELTGVTLPFGCRTGACGSCAGRLLEGTVAYDRPPRALKDRHREAGYVLCCLARPRTDCRVAVGPDVLAGLHRNPWK